MSNASKTLKQIGGVRLLDTTNVRIAKQFNLAPGMKDKLPMLRRHSAAASLWVVPAMGAGLIPAQYSARNRNTGGSNPATMANQIRGGKWDPIAGGPFYFDRAGLSVDGKHRWIAIMLGGHDVVICVFENVEVGDLHVHCTKKKYTLDQHCARLTSDEKQLLFGSRSRVRQMVSGMRLALHPWTPRRPMVYTDADAFGGWYLYMLDDAIEVLSEFPRNGALVRNIAVLPFWMFYYYVDHETYQQAVRTWTGQGSSIPGMKAIVDTRDWALKRLQAIDKNTPTASLAVMMVLFGALNAVADGDGDTYQIDTTFSGSISGARELGIPFEWPDEINQRIPAFAAALA